MQFNNRNNRTYTSEIGIYIVKIIKEERKKIV